MKKTWISLACTVACSPAFAQPGAERIELSKLDANNLPAVVVHSHQSFESDELAPPSATVITRSDIENAGYTTIAEIIEKLGFVATRQGLSGTRDATYDLRGYGGTASSNLAVIVDGVRYSVKEQAAARISAVPVQSIEKVEIIRGGSSVAYGDGASAGVIRITTRSPQAGAAPARARRPAPAAARHPAPPGGGARHTAGCGLCGWPPGRVPDRRRRRSHAHGHQCGARRAARRFS